MKNKRLKCRSSIALMTSVLLGTMPVFAGQPQIVTGTLNLVSAVTLILAGCVAAVTIVFVLINGFKMQTCEEEEKIKYKKQIKNVIIIGVFLVTISGTIGWIFSFYGASA